MKNVIRKIKFERKLLLKQIYGRSHRMIQVILLSTIGSTNPGKEEKTIKIFVRN